MAVKIREEMDECRTLKYTHSSATVKDTIYLLGGRPILAINSAAANAANAFVYEGMIEYAKTSAEAWTVGVTVYWDNTNGVFTTTATANTKAGIALEAAANPSSTGLLLLMPQVNA